MSGPDQNATRRRCWKCNERFSNRTLLRTHLLAAHGVSVPVLRFRCPVRECAWIGTSTHTRQRHLDKVHRPQAPEALR